jgi:drug/metabolite transporter (DMT)-like permease
MAILLVLCAVWGVTQVAIKIGNTGLSPLFHAGVRSAISAVLLWGWSAARGVPLFARDGSLGHGLLIGGLFAGEFLLIYQGLEYTTAARGVLFVYTAPFVVALGAHALVPGERLRARTVAGLAFAFAGIAVAFADALRLPSYREMVGDLMQLGGAVCWGATTVAVKARRGAPLSPNKTLFYQLAGSAVVLLVLSAMLGEPGVVAPTPLVVGALLYQAVVVAFVSYLAWFWLLTRYPAAELSAFSFLTPLFGMAAGALLLGEPVGPALAVAMTLVAAGIYLVNSRPAARA